VDVTGGRQCLGPNAECSTTLAALGSRLGTGDCSRGPQTAILFRMPIFEYRCERCDHRFEALVFGSKQPACPACAATTLEKQLSTFATHVAGASAARATPGPCGTCGDPRGAGSCSMN